MLLLLLLTSSFLAPSSPAPVPVAPAPEYLYKMTLVRAAPGKLLDLIAHVRGERAVAEDRGEVPPFWMRHSQGDQWDLLLLYPIESYEAFYHPDRQTRHAEAATLNREREPLVAWQEDLYIYGPSLDDMRTSYEGAGFFHVEMFQGLPGKRAELYAEREMENAYLAELGRPANLIFARHQGAAWDVITIGFYRDIKHFAESADIPLEAEEQAALKAGFEGVSMISPYLRSLIREHHDTLAVALPQ